MQISPKQIKLARISLGWTQAELAKNVQMDKSSIINLENGKNKPQMAKFEKIVSVLRRGGIEFIEGNGIRDRSEILEKYYGVEGFRQFMDNVYETVKETGGDVCLFNSKPRLWHEYLGEDWYNKHAQRMQGLGDKISVRIIVEKGEENFILDSAEHKWCTKSKFKGKVTYYYGDKLAFLSFKKNHIEIIVINQSDFAKNWKDMFDVFWQHEAKQVGQ